MAELKRKKVRVPIIPLEYDSVQLSKNAEIIVDRQKRKLYVKNLNTDEIIDLISIPYIKELLTEHIDQVIEGASDQYNTIGKIDRLIKNIEDWKNNIAKPIDENTDKTKLVNSLEKIFDKFKDMSENDQNVIDLLNKRQSKEIGKDLVETDYTNQLKDKLRDIEKGANRYEHPHKLMCDHRPIITSINGLKNLNNGNIWLSYKDFDELKNIDPAANNYTHPENQVCIYKFSVVSINDESGDVVLTKTSFDMNNIKNYKLSTKDDILNNSDDTILSHSDALNIIENFISNLM